MTIPDRAPRDAHPGRDSILPTMVGVLCGTAALAQLASGTPSALRSVLAVVAAAGLAASGLQLAGRGSRLVTGVVGALGLLAVAALATSYLRPGA